MGYPVDMTKTTHKIGLADELLPALEGLVVLSRSHMAISTFDLGKHGTYSLVYPQAEAALL